MARACGQDRRRVQTSEFPLNIEIERKFLLRGDEWRGLATSRSTMRQAYLSSTDKASIRVRIKDDASATLSIKSRPWELRRLELEYPIPVLEAEALLQLREGSVIEKVRHIVPWHDLAWEIDVFFGENSGLVIAEIELRHENQRIDLPVWLGPEVTGQSQYYNSFLTRRPFSTWSRFPDTAMLARKLG
jgi:adenylate cyclase